MEIKRINVYGYGILINREYELGKGINLIYGPNESGKSSLHSFISACFYGMLRDGSKRAQFNDEYKLYEPWNSKVYGGSIFFSFAGKNYYAEQIFDSNKRSTVLKRTDTCEDLSKEIDPYGPRGTKQIGNYLFGFGPSVFNRTFCVSRTRENFDAGTEEEISKRFLNRQNSGDEDISIRAAIEYLERMESEIGTKRAYTKPYGKSYSEFLQISQEISEISNAIKSQKEMLSGMKSVDDRLRILREKKDNLKKIDMALKYKMIEERVSDRKNLYKSISVYEEEIKNLKSEGVLEDSAYNKLEHLKKEIESDISNIDELSQEINVLDGKAASLKSSLHDTSELNALETAQKTLQDISNKIKLNNAVIESSEKGTGARDFESSKRKSSALFLSAAVAAVYFIFFLYYSIKRDAGMVYYITSSVLAILSFSASVYFAKKYKNSEIYEDRSDDMRLENENVELREIIKTELKKLGFSDEMELKNMISYLQEQQKSNDSIQARIDELEKSSEAAEKFASKLESRIEACREEYRQNLSYFGVKEGVSLIKLNERYKRLNSLYAKCDELKNLLKENQTEESDRAMIMEFGKFAEFAGLDTSGYSLDSVAFELDKVNSMEDELIKDYKKFEIQLEKIADNHSLLRDREERLKDLESEMEEYRNKLDNIDIVKSTFEDIARTNYAKMSGELNEKVSQYMKKISDNKYERVYIDGNLGIELEEAETGKIISVKSLSEGAKDQADLALRLALMKYVEKDRMPLILDEAFVNFDDKRLEKIFEALKVISKERQIIIFTCHNRENRILQLLNADYNFVEV